MKSADLNTTIASLQAALVSLPFVAAKGNVGIGTASPGTTHEEASSSNNFFTLTRTNKAAGSGGFNINVENNSQATFSYDSTNSIIFGTSSNPVSQTGFSERMRINSSGNVGIGTASPTNPLEMGSGARVIASGVWTNASSKINKENIDDISTKDAFEAFSKLSPKRHNYKNEKEEEYLGFLAEDVPALVAMKDRKSLSAMDIAAITVKVVQEQERTIGELRREILEIKHLVGNQRK